MTFFRRIPLILLGLMLVALVTIILLLPDTLVTIGQNLAQISPIIRIVLVIVANVLILGLLYLRIRPLPTPNRSGLSVRTSGALADLSPESAQQRILKVIRGVPSVVSAEANLTAIEGKADIDMDIGVVGDTVNVPKKQEEIERALRQVMLKQLGLQLASRPRIHIRLMTEEELAPPPRPIAPRTSVEAPIAPPVIREEPRSPAPRFEERPPIREEVTPPPSTAVAPPDVIPTPVVREEAPPAPEVDEVTPPESPIIPQPPAESTADDLPSSDADSVGLYDEDEEPPASRNEGWPPPPPTDA